MWCFRFFPRNRFTVIGGCPATCSLRSIQWKIWWMMDGCFLTSVRWMVQPLEVFLFSSIWGWQMLALWVTDCHRCNYAATYVLEISDTQILLEGKKRGNGNDLKLLAKQHPSHPNHILTTSYNNCSTYLSVKTWLRNVGNWFYWFVHSYSNNP